MNDLVDGEALMLVQEHDEAARNILFERYKYIIDILIKKYSVSIRYLGLDKNDIYGEALYGFTDALNSYNPDKEASLQTFITLCVERRIQKCLKSANAQKNQINKDSYSLDYIYDEYGFSLVDIISDNNKNDPLFNLTNDENARELYYEIKDTLSILETKVFKYLLQGLNYTEIALLMDKDPKQIDNTIQRIKSKVKSLLKQM